MKLTDAIRAIAYAALEDRSRMTDRCPKCDANLDGGSIPEAKREGHSPPYRWSRRIDVVDRNLDRVTAHICPDCGYRWDRE